MADTAKKPESLGNCFVCGAELGKIKMKNHVIKAHCAGDAEAGEPALLLKVEGAYEPEYWLLLDVAAKASLKKLNEFLRRIWLECCGHMSLFLDADGNKIGMTKQIGDLTPGDRIEYQYDMGSTTELVITALAQTRRPAQKGAVRLLARNAPPRFECARCGRPAGFIYTDYDSDDPEAKYYCEECVNAQKLEEDYLLPITNSPRMGVCAYDGEQDVWTFDPAKFA